MTFTERKEGGATNKPLSEQYRLIAKQWVAAEAAASLLEETKSAFLAKMMTSLGDMPVSRAEMQVKADARWYRFIEGMVEARSNAALLKVQLEYVRMRHSEQQSEEASKRAEMRL
jgi:hypothetical protein